MMWGGRIYSLLANTYEAKRLHLAYRCGEPGGSWLATDKLDVYDVFAVLCAVGCPRLAFLLTDFDPRDPLDEKLAEQKLWIFRAGKFRTSSGETVLGGGYWGFMVYTEVLRCASDEELARKRERARAGDIGTAAELAVKLEMARFAELADAGFPDLSRIFDRYVDVLGELGIGYEYLPSGEERRIGAFVKVYRSDQVPRGVKESGMRVVHHTLRELARVLLPIYYSRPWGYLVVHSVS
jgi:hypothetical protein